MQVQKERDLDREKFTCIANRTVETGEVSGTKMSGPAPSAEHPPIPSSCNRCMGSDRSQVPSSPSPFSPTHYLAKLARGHFPWHEVAEG